MHEFDGRDNSEGRDCVGDMKLASGNVALVFSIFTVKKTSIMNVTYVMVAIIVSNMKKQVRNRCLGL